MKENKRKLTNLFTEVIYCSTLNGDEKGRTGIGGQSWRGWVRWTKANWAPVKVHYGRRNKYQNKRYKPLMVVI